MPTMNAKNVPLSAVGADLGLTDQINQDMQDKLEEEKRRKALLGVGAMSPAAQALGLTPVTMGSAGTG